MKASQADVNFCSISKITLNVMSVIEMVLMHINIKKRKTIEIKQITYLPDNNNNYY